MLIAVVLGVFAGWLITRSRYLTQVLEPVVSGLFAIPITLFFPVFILMFGIGPESKVAYGAAYGFFPDRAEHDRRARGRRSSAI